MPFSQNSLNELPNSREIVEVVDYMCTSVIVGDEQTGLIEVEIVNCHGMLCRQYECYSVPLRIDSEFLGQFLDGAAVEGVTEPIH